ncbi:hypothetical protein ABH926_007998 [Catenulispora sp. GP43]|uniref:hypothetical protein n=1 Tax=Catenulispora sp. GP43 TaxID=3156263 RepID=UPI003510EEB1
MTDDLYPTQTLATALHTMADSDQPPVMDVEHVLREGRHSLVRRRMAALGGGTAVLAASALAVGTLTGMGSGVGGGSEPAASSTSYVVDPHDPVVTHWQFAYVPPGMIAYGGYDPTDEQVSTMMESESGRFQLELTPMQAPIAIGGKGASAPTQKVPVKVPGTTTAYWLGYGNDRIILSNGEGGEMADLALRLKSGQWVQIGVNNLEERKDWKEQALKAAASLVKKDRSVPMPFRVAEVPQSFKPLPGGNALHKNGLTNADIGFRLGQDQHAPTVGIFAFTTGAEKIPAQHGTEYTCRDSNGLTVCVSVSDPEPKELKAVGGARGLLDRVTSLGNNPANWTTDVFH